MLQGQNHGENSVSSLTGSKNILIALGSNLAPSKGSLTATLTAALKTLEIRGAVIRAISPFYHTPAFPEGAGPDYLNAAASLDVPWDVSEVLSHLHAVEAEMGRERVQRWGQRTLDLDLLAMGEIVLPDAATHREWRELPLQAQADEAPAELILPHPRLQDRAFVLVPLADIAPDWQHPLLGMTVAEMLNALPETLKSEVKRAH